jgi:transmembrane sensor
MAYDPEYFEDLVIRKFSGISTPEEDACIREMLERHEAARKLYKDLVAMENSEALQECLQNFDPEKSLAAIITPARKNSRQQRVIVLSAAAILVAAILGTSIFLLLYNHTTPASERGIVLKLSDGREYHLPATKGASAVINTGPATLRADSALLNFTALRNEDNNAMNSLTVPAGMNYKIVLADSSVLRLNAGTRLQFPFSFSGNNREISLDGEAYLEVAQNPDKPFIIHTPNSTIQVLGTSFNVHTYDSGIVRVGLVNGAVLLKAADQEIIIKPGQEAVYTFRKGITVRPFDEAALGWLGGYYYFEDMRLDEIAPVLQRAFGTEIILDDPDMAKERFSAPLDKKHSLSFFMDNLRRSATYRIEYYFDKDKALHLRYEAQ